MVASAPSRPTAPLRGELARRLKLNAELKAIPPSDEHTSLAEFVQAFWSTVEPSIPLIWGWHIDAICDHLEAVTDGRIRNLVINVPPRHSKSTIVSVMWPCWEWTFRPWKRFMFASYSSGLSERDSRHCRSLIRSPLYRRLYGNRFALAKSGGDEKNTVSKFENTRGGYRIATSVTGLATGEGADTIVADDAINTNEANSPVIIENVNRWWGETMPSRLNDPKTGSKVIIMQRLHESDLTGYVLSMGAGYVYLCLPMEYEVPRDPEGKPLPKPVTPIGWSDPRNEDGELLCPAYYGPNEIVDLRKQISDYAWAGQYQQRPAPREGGMFNLSKLKIIPAIPQNAQLIRVRAWDRAATAGGGAYTAGVLLSMDVVTRTFYIEHMVRGQWATDEREQKTLSTAQEDGRYTYVLLEREPGSAGIDSVVSTGKLLLGYTVIPERPTGNKEIRCEPFASQMALGNVCLVQGDWNYALLQEMEMFPNSRYRDQCDSISLGFNWLSKTVAPGRVSVVSPPRERFAVR